MVGWLQGELRLQKSQLADTPWRLCQTLCWLAMESVAAAQAKVPNCVCFCLHALQVWLGGPPWVRSGPVDSKSRSPRTCFVTHTSQVLETSTGVSAGLQSFWGGGSPQFGGWQGTQDMGRDSSDKSNSYSIHGPEGSLDTSRGNQDFLL